MPFSGLQIVSADQLNWLQPYSDNAEATGTLDVTTAVQDVPGASITVTTATNGAVYVVNGSIDIVQDGAAGDSVFGSLYVDGNSVGKIITFRGQAVTDRAQLHQTWRGTLPTAGLHTFVLRGNATANAKYNINSTQSGLVVTIYEVV